MEHLCTGHYMNYYGDNFDLFVIINEGNGEATNALSVNKINKADKICEEFCTGKEMNVKECRELEELLEVVFEYGVQVFKKR